jgi:hypothetical protein
VSAASTESGASQLTGSACTSMSRPFAARPKSRDEKDRDGQPRSWTGKPKTPRGGTTGDMVANLA